MAKHVSSEVPVLVTYLRSIGAGGLLLGGAGLMFTAQELFWWAAGFIYIGLAALALDAWCEPNFRKPKTKWIRYACVLVLAAIAIFFSRGLVFYPAPLLVEPLSYGGRYPVGESVYGIKWEEGMSDLRISITNSTDRDYDHFSVVVEPDKFIRSQAQISNVANVTLEPWTKSVHVNQTDDQGKIVGEYNKPASAYESVRVSCEKLPKGSTLSLLFAVSGITMEAGKLLNGGITLLGVKPPSQRIWLKERATRVYIHATYSVLNRPHEIKLTYGVLSE